MPRIDLTGLPDKTAQSIDLSGLPDNWPVQDTTVHTGPDLSSLPDRDKAENALSMAATFDIQPSMAYRYHDDIKKGMEEKGLATTAKKAFLSGIGDVYDTAGSALKWLGHDDQAKIYGDFGKRLKRAYAYEMKPEEFTWKRVIEPEWWATTVTRSVPFTLSLIPASLLAAYGGAGTATAMGLGTFGRVVLGSIAGSAVSRPMEAALEAGGTYQEALGKGKSESEAHEAADLVFRGNLALTGMDAAELALAFTPLKVMGTSATKSLARRILASGGKLAGVGAMESGEEGYQEALQRIGMGEAVSWNDQMKESMAIGGIFGVGMAGTGSVYTALRDRITDSMAPELKAQVEAIKKEATSKGASDQEAELKALDAIADRPEGKEHIEKVLDGLKNPENAEVSQLEAGQQVEGKETQISEEGEQALTDRWEAARRDFEEWEKQAGPVGVDTVSSSEVEYKNETSIKEQLDLFGDIPADRGDLGHWSSEELHSIQSSSQPEVQSVLQGYYKGGKIAAYDGDIARLGQLNLVKYPNEHLLSVVTDKNDKIINILAHTTGKKTESAADVGEIAGQALNTKGAKNVWLLHQHPSGDSSLSGREGDERVFDSLRNALSGTEITARDIIAVSHDDTYSSYSGGKYRVPIPSGAQPVGPIRKVAREFKAFGNNDIRITDQDALKAFGGKNLPEGGIILVNIKLSPVATFKPDSYSVLRGKTQAEILREAEKRNATGMFVYEPEKPVNAFNVVKFARALGLSLHDIVDVTGSEAASGGLSGLKSQVADATFLSVQKKQEPGNLYVAHNLSNERSLSDIVEITSTIHDIFKRSLTHEALERTTINLQPVLDLRGRNLKKTLEQHGKNVDLSNILGATTISDIGALVELSYNYDNATVERTAYHELYHVAKRWLLSDKESFFMDEEFENEEAEAEAFADFAINQKSPDRSLVQRIFEKIARILSQIRNALQGKGFVTAEDIFSNLYLGRYSGMQSTGTRGNGPGTDLLSISNDSKSFAKQLDDYVEGKLHRLEVLTVSSTPDVLTALGAEQLPVVVTQSTLHKIMRGGKRTLPVDLIKQLPEKIADPIMVFDSKTQPDALLVMTELKHEGKTIVAAIHLSKETGRYVVNNMASVYGKDNKNIFAEWIRDGYLRYMNKKKSREWSVTSGLQLPTVRGSIPGRRKTVLFDYDLVKHKPDTMLSVEQPPVPENPLFEETYDGYDFGPGDERINAEARRIALEKVENWLEDEKKKELRQFRKQAELAVESDGIHAIMKDVVKRGGFSKAMLLKDYNQDTITDLVRKRPGLVTEAGKLALDIVADDYGYQYDNDLMEDLLAAPLKRDAIEREYNALVSYFYDEVFATVEESVAARLMEEEFKALSELTKKYKPRPARGLKPANSGDTLLISLFRSRALRLKFSAQKVFHCPNKRISS